MRAFNKQHFYCVLISLTSFVCAIPASSQLLPYTADMADSVSNSELSEFTFRFDGAKADDQLGYYAINAGDFDGNGKTDLLVGARQNFAGISKGETYLIFDDTLDEIRTQNSGNIIDLKNLGQNSNWNIKFVGENSGDKGARVTLVDDFNNDGIDDFIINSYLANTTASGAGKTYFIMKKQGFANGISFLKANINTSRTRGQIVQLSNSLNWDLRIDGFAHLGNSGLTTLTADLNNNGVKDIFIGQQSDSQYGILDNHRLVPSYMNDGSVGEIISLANSNDYTFKLTTASAPFVVHSMNDSFKLDDFNADGYLDWAMVVFDANANDVASTKRRLIIFNGKDLACFNKQTGQACDYSNLTGNVPMSEIQYTQILADRSTQQVGQTQCELLDPPITIGTHILGWLSGFHLGDFDDDGKTDIIIADQNIKLEGNQRENGSKLYVLLNDKLQFHQTTGQTRTRNLTNPNNWDLKINTPGIASPHSYYGIIKPINLNPGTVGSLPSSYIAEDVNNDGKDDIIFGHALSTPEEADDKIGAGDWFVIFNKTIQDAIDNYNPVNPVLSKTLSINLVSESGYDIRYTGAKGASINYSANICNNTVNTPGDRFGYSHPVFKDINNDGAVDAIAPALQASPNNRAGAGSVYVIEYFPHEILPDDSTGTDFFDPDGFDFTGIVTAPNNVSTINNVQFGHHRSFGKDASEVCPNLDPTCIVNSDEFHMLWIDCDAVDGSFDSNSEAYSCSHSPLSLNAGHIFEAPHQLYMRAQDEKGIWTPVSSYQLLQFPPQPPALLTQIQGLANHPDHQNNQPSTPWLTVATKQITTQSARIALERAEVSQGAISVAERVGWMTIESGRRGAFEDDFGQTVVYETKLTNLLFNGFGSCSEQSFRTPFTNPPLVIASQSTRAGGDGGWLRSCNINSSGAGFYIEEDLYRDSERGHTKESASLIAFSKAFRKRFSQGAENWQMQVDEVEVPGNWYKTFHFDTPFDQRPMIFVLPSQSGTYPASIRIKDITKNSFKARVVEPLNGDGKHNKQTIPYLAITPGNHSLPDGTKIKVSQSHIANFKAGVGVSGTQGWHTLNF